MAIFINVIKECVNTAYMYSSNKTFFSDPSDYKIKIGLSNVWLFSSMLSKTVLIQLKCIVRTKHFFFFSSINIEPEMPDEASEGQPSNER